jgi:hypothetical protein
MEIGQGTAAQADLHQGLGQIRSGGQGLEAVPPPIPGVDYGCIESFPGAALIPERILEDFTSFLFSAVTITSCATLKLTHHVIVYVLDQEMSHGGIIP